MITDDKNVADTSSERPIKSILDVDNVKSSQMPLPANDSPHSAHVTPTRDHAHGADIEFDKVAELVVLQVEFDGVVDADEGVRIPDRPSVVRHDVRYASHAESDAFHLQQLVFGFFWCDAVDGEATFDVVNDAEVLVGLLDRDHVHEAGGVSDIRADFVVDLDEPLHEDGLHLPSIQCVF